MVTFCFLNIYLGHIESSTLVVTVSSIDGRGKQVSNYDDMILVLRLGMVFDMVEYLEF